MELLICMVAVAAWCAWLGWKRRVGLGLVSGVLLPATVAIMAGFHEHPVGLNGSDVRRVVFGWFLAVAVSTFAGGALGRVIAGRIAGKNDPRA